MFRMLEVVLVVGAFVASSGALASSADGDAPFHQQFQALEGELEQMRIDLGRERGSKEVYQQMVDKLEARRADAEEAWRSAEERAKQAVERVEAVEADLDAARRHADAVSEELVATRAQHQSGRGGSAELEAKLKAAEEESDTVKEKLKIALEASRTMEERAYLAVQDLQQTDAQRDAARSEVASLKERLEVANRESESTRATMERNALAEREALQHTIAVVTKSRDDLLRQVAELEDALVKSRNAGTASFIVQAVWNTIDRLASQSQPTVKLAIGVSRAAIVKYQDFISSTPVIDALNVVMPLLRPLQLTASEVTSQIGQVVQRVSSEVLGHARVDAARKSMLSIVNGSAGDPRVVIVTGATIFLGLLSLLALRRAAGKPATPGNGVPETTPRKKRVSDASAESLSRRTKMSTSSKTPSGENLPTSSGRESAPPVSADGSARPSPAQLRYMTRQTDSTSSVRRSARHV